MKNGRLQLSPYAALLVAWVVAFHVAGRAAAQDSFDGGRGRAGDRFDAHGHLLLGVERLFGVNYISNTTESNGVKNTASSVAASFLFGSDPRQISGYTAPRLGVDYVVIDHLTVGGALGIISVSRKEKTTASGVSQSQDGPSSTGFTFAPRAGFALELTPLISLWLRGGFTYFSVTQDQQILNGASGLTVTTKESLDGVALDLLPQLVIMPNPHVGFTVELSTDIPLGGSDKTTTGTGSTSVSWQVFNVGLNAGLLARF